MNYYPFHIGDYATHTLHLEPLEDLAYRRLLDLYYLREGELPLDVAECARLIRMRSEVDLVSAVLNEFFEQMPTGWFSERCSNELERMLDKQAKAQASARASVAARKAKAEQPRNDGSTDVQRPLGDRSTDAELPTPTPTPTPTPFKTKSAAAPVFVLPDWIPGDAWAGYIDMRKRIKKPMTPRAMDLAVAKLADLMRAGSDPKEVLDQSTMNSWQGLFEIKARGITTTGQKFDPVAFVNSVRKEASNVIDVTAH